MTRPFYTLGQQHVLTRYGVKTAASPGDIASLELILRDLLDAGQQIGIVDGRLPIPIGTGAGFASALNTDGNVVAHGFGTGLGAHYGSRLGDHVGSGAGALLSAIIKAVPLPAGARGVQTVVADQMPRIGGMLGELTGARYGANGADSLISAFENKRSKK